MAETEAEQLERILDDILANDAEIKGGAEAAGLDIENLREVVLRRKDDVWEACLAEQNAVNELEEERSRDSFQRSSLMKNLRRRLFIYVCILSGTAGLGVIIGVVGYINGGTWLLIAGLGLISLALLLLGVVLPYSLLREKRYKSILDKELEEVQLRLDAANKLLEQASEKRASAECSGR